VLSCISGPKAGPPAAARRNAPTWRLLLGSSGVIVVLLLCLGGYFTGRERRAAEAERKYAEQKQSEQAGKAASYEALIRKLGELEPALEANIKEERFDQLVGDVFDELKLQGLPDGGYWDALLQRMGRNCDRLARCFTFRKQWTEKFGGDPMDENTPDPDRSCADYRESFKAELAGLRDAASELRGRVLELGGKRPSDGNAQSPALARSRWGSMDSASQRKSFDEALMQAGDPLSRQQAAAGSGNDDPTALRMMLGAPPGRQPAADTGELAPDQRRLLKDLELSYEETADLKAWIAAGVPRQWRGKRQFPTFTDGQWDAFKRALLGRADELGVQIPVGAR
jgi:hypothetical protein